jgi:hypothetical protein
LPRMWLKSFSWLQRRWTLYSQVADYQPRGATFLSLKRFIRS